MSIYSTLDITRENAEEAYVKLRQLQMRRKLRAEAVEKTDVQLEDSVEVMLREFDLYPFNNIIIGKCDEPDSIFIPDDPEEY